MINTEVFNFKDRFGNEFKFNFGGRLELKLKGKSRWRNLGELINIKTHEGVLTIYKKHDTELQIHQKSNSWSIPSHIWNNVDGVWIVTQKRNYKILKRGTDISYLHFKESGYELKVYIPLNLWRTHE